jgi:hypothetical protein
VVLPRGLIDLGLALAGLADDAHGVAGGPGLPLGYNDARMGLRGRLAVSGGRGDQPEQHGDDHDQHASGDRPAGRRQKRNGGARPHG